MKTFRFEFSWKPVVLADKKKLYSLNKSVEAVARIDVAEK